VTAMVSPTDPSSRPLALWGWDDSFRQLFEDEALPGDEPGRIVRADLRACAVALERGEVHVPVGRHLLSSGSSQPTTGDWVVVRDGEIASVLDRRTAVVRASADPGKGAQVLAANVEFVLVAEPLGERWRPRRLERLLVVAWQSAAIPIVVLTKADRCDDIEAALSLARAVAPGASVYAVSPLYGDGTEELAKALVPGTTAVIIGRSGAGKSTLANALSGGKAGLDTGAVRDDNKGRHTTVTRELVILANGALLIDTPGVRAIGLIDSTEAIGDAFSDLEALAPNCRFGDCAHESEPGCAVQEAISAGELDAERLASYRRLQREQERLEAREDPRLRAAKAAEWRRFSKEIRRLPKH
jgi:ribosome biogenesis GTPase